MLHSRYVNVGMRIKGKRARMASALGLYTERKSCAASSATWHASGIANTSHAVPKVRVPIAFIAALEFDLVKDYSPVLRYLIPFFLPGCQRFLRWLRLCPLHQHILEHFDGTIG